MKIVLKITLSMIYEDFFDFRNHTLFYSHYLPRVPSTLIDSLAAIPYFLFSKIRMRVAG